LIDFTFMMQSYKNLAEKLNFLKTFSKNCNFAA